MNPNDELEIIWFALRVIVIAVLFTAGTFIVSLMFELFTYLYKKWNV